MTSPAWWMAALLASMALAGCAQAHDPVPATTPQDSVSAGGQGGLQGQLIDDEERPVANARVRIVDLDVATVTDEAGGFGFDLLPVGTYNVAAVKAGYQTTVQRVQVTQGPAVTIRLLVVPVAVIPDEGYERVWQETGYFQCSWLLVASQGECGYVTNTYGTLGNPLEAAWTQSEYSFVFESERGAMTVVLEAEWTQSTASTADMLSLELAAANRTEPLHQWYCSADGSSPLTLRWERHFEEGDPDWQNPGACPTGTARTSRTEYHPTLEEDGQELVIALASSGNSATSQTSLVGVTFMQGFDVWASVFYWTPAPETYSALDL